MLIYPPYIHVICFHYNYMYIYYCSLFIYTLYVFAHVQMFSFFQLNIAMHILFLSYLLTTFYLLISRPIIFVFDLNSSNHLYLWYILFPYCLKMSTLVSNKYAYYLYIIMFIHLLLYIIYRLTIIFIPWR